MARLKNKNIKIVLTILIVVLVGIVLWGVDGEVKAVEISATCRKSAECMEAAKKEAEANKEAEDAVSTANSYQNKVNEATAEIAEKEREIAESEANVADLKKKITQNEQKILSDREALIELLVNMHFESSAEPIKILAGASSISDLAEKAAREATAREQINAQATKIKQEKEQLEKDKAEVETHLAEQQQAKQELMVAKKEREDLVAQYQADAEKYEQVAAAEREKKQAAERQWQESHKTTFSGGTYLKKNVASSDSVGDVAGGVQIADYSGDDDTYPWKGDCPGKQDYYLTYLGGYKIGGYVCECVSYAGWKAYEAYGVVVGWGNAYSWDDVARRKGYTVDHNPEAGTIGQVDGGAYGHVFWVESVNSDGSVNVTEYNNAYATYLYSGHSHYGDFGARTISAGEAARYNYIHF